MTTPRLDEIGPYRVESHLGAGGMGDVFQAWDERLQRGVAIKVLHAGSQSPERRQRLLREARAVAALNHPSIVQIFHILDTPHGDAIVMEMVAGETLAQRLEGGPLPVGEVVALARQIAAGLVAAHGQGIVHRDLKTENVMVTGDGQAKILDFGLAKSLRPEEATQAEVSEPGAVRGTYRAMSPEQARGRGVDARSDLFSLGILLYEVLTGVSPFLADSVLDTLTRICTHQPPSLQDVDPGIPAELSRLVDQLLEKDPTRRPQSAAAVLARLMAVDSPSAVDPAATTVIGPPGKPRRRRWPWAGLVLLLCAGINRRGVVNERVIR